MQVGTVNDCIGIAEARAEGSLERDVNDLLAGKPVHQPQPIDVDRLGASAITYTQSVEAMKCVRRNLNTGADLPQCGRLLQNKTGNLLASQRKGRGDAANTTAGYQQLIHFMLLKCNQYYAHRAD